MGTRFYQSLVMGDLGFIGTIESSVMRVAYDVLTESPDTPGHEERMGVARALFQGNVDDVDRFVRLFAWRAVFDQAVQDAVYDRATKEITPDQLDDTVVDALVLDFWNVAANYSPLPIVPDNEPAVEDTPE